VPHDSQIPGLSTTGLTKSPPVRSIRHDSAVRAALHRREVVDRADTVNSPYNTLPAHRLPPGNRQPLGRLHPLRCTRRRGN